MDMDRHERSESIDRKRKINGKTNRYTSMIPNTSICTCIHITHFIPAETVAETPQGLMTCSFLKNLKKPSGIKQFMIMATQK